MMGGSDPDNRRYLGVDGIKASKTNPVYLHLQKLNAVRRANPALQKGVQTRLSGAKDQYVFKREYNGESVFVFLNKDQNGAAVTVSVLPPGNYTDIYSGETFSANKRGRFTLNIPAHGLRALTSGAIRGEPWKMPENYRADRPHAKTDGDMHKIEAETQKLVPPAT